MAARPARRLSRCPEWAKRMRQGQAIHRGVETAAHAVGSGHGGGGSTSLDLSESSE